MSAPHRFRYVDPTARRGLVYELYVRLASSRSATWLESERERTGYGSSPTASSRRLRRIVAARGALAGPFPSCSSFRATDRLPDMLTPARGSDGARTAQDPDALEAFDSSYAEAVKLLFDLAPYPELTWLALLALWAPAEVPA